MLSGLVGKQVAVSPGAPVTPEPNRPVTVAIYTAPDMSVNALCVMDLGASAYTAGALALLPPGGARTPSRRTGAQPDAARGAARGRQRALGAVQHPGCPALEAEQARTRTARTSRATSRACSRASTGSTSRSRCPATARAASRSSCLTLRPRTHRGRCRSAVPGALRSRLHGRLRGPLARRADRVRLRTLPAPGPATRAVHVQQLGQRGLAVVDRGRQAGPHVLGAPVDVPAVRDRQPRHQVQAQAALGGVAVHRRLRASTRGARSLTSSSQPPLPATTVATTGDSPCRSALDASSSKASTSRSPAVSSPSRGKPTSPSRPRSPARAAGSSATVPRSQRHTSPRPSGSGRSGHASRPMPCPPRVRRMSRQSRGCPAGARPRQP